jgi:hypothetical protein
LYFINKKNVGIFKDLLSSPLKPDIQLIAFWGPLNIASSNNFINTDVAHSIIANTRK